MTGHLLVASFGLTDKNFRRAVVLVLAHDASEGAAGIVLNRPTSMEPPDRLGAWQALATTPAVLFKGGPVSPDAVIAVGVARPDRAPGGWQALHGRLGVIDLQSPAAPHGEDIEGIRLFAGYAGWQGGQLEQEIATGAWFVVSSQPDDALTTAPEELWRAVLARQGGLFTTVPLDPNLN